MKTMQTLSDADLIHLLPKRKEAFDVLFLRYKQDLRNLVARYIKDRHEAEDFVQEAFLKIYLSLKAGKYCDEGKFLPWALRIAHNLCLDHLRKTKRSFTTRLDESKELTCWFSDSTENNLLQKERQRQLNVLTEKLPPVQRQTVAYRYYEGLSFKEIAGLMNTSVNTSLGRMRYALGHLRSQLINRPSLR